MTHIDYLAVVFFIATWSLFNWLTSVERTASHMSITRAMAIHRAR